LEEQGRFPDAGLAGDEIGAAADQPTAEHAVELADARAARDRGVRSDVRERHGWRAF
jgi:hypothetical protein